MTSATKPPVLSQPALIGAILSEIGNQQPGATISHQRRTVQSDHQSR